MEIRSWRITNNYVVGYVLKIVVFPFLGCESCHVLYVYIYIFISGKGMYIKVCFISWEGPCPLPNWIKDEFFWVWWNYKSLEGT